MRTEGGGGTALGGSRETVVRTAVLPSGFDAERAEQWAASVRPKWHAAWGMLGAHPAPVAEAVNDAPRHAEFEKLTPAPVVQVTPAEATISEAPQSLDVEQPGDALADALPVQPSLEPATAAAPPVETAEQPFASPLAPPSLDAPETPRLELPVNGQHPGRFVAVGLLAAVAAAVGFFAVRGGDFARSRVSEPESPSAAAGPASAAPAPHPPPAPEPMAPPPPALPAQPVKAESETATQPSANPPATSQATPAKPSALATPTKAAPASMPPPSAAKPNITAIPRPSTPPAPRPVPHLKPPPSALMPPAPSAPASQSPQSPNIVRDSPF